MAADVSPSLMRSLRRGSVGTSTLPSGGPVKGPLSFEEGPADGQLASMQLDREQLSESVDFAELFQDAQVSGGASVQSASEPAAELEAGGRAARFGSSFRQEARPPEAATSIPAGAEKVRSRAERFAAGDFPAAEMPQEPAPPKSQRSWSKYIDEGDRVDAVTVKKAISAAKVITPLVAAVSFAPGSDSDGAAKGAALTEMLVAMHRCAVSTTESISDRLGKDVPMWMLTQVMQAMSLAIGRRWEAGLGVDMPSLASNMAEIFGDRSPEIGDLILGASEDAYVEVTNPDVATFRIGVSASEAAWRLYEWITHPRLSLDEKGDMPSRFFTYGMKPSDLVRMMLVRCVDECRGLVAQVDSADIRTSHMQSAIREMTKMVGSEYVTRTRHTMNWIADPLISDQEYQLRMDSACRGLETDLLPQIFEMARINFISIERGAQRAIEDLNEKYKQEGFVPHSDTRPAAQ